MYISPKIRATVVSVLKKIFRKLGIGITTYATLVDLEAKSVNKSNQDFNFIRVLNLVNYQKTLELLDKSISQFRQDLFVLNETKFKRNGYFVEFGATNGLDKSNTYLLEKEYSWIGILAEPARVWEKELRENRPNAAIETLCVWNESNSKLVFNETELPELSTVDTFTHQDMHKDNRILGKRYEVKTISLLDLLRKYEAPQYIDYLSIDTEGSEFEILEAFDFNEYTFGVITIEHNYTFRRDMIFDLLTRNGYRRKYEEVGKDGGTSKVAAEEG